MRFQSLGLKFLWQIHEIRNLTSQTELLLLNRTQYGVWSGESIFIHRYIKTNSDLGRSSQFTAEKDRILHCTFSLLITAEKTRIKHCKGISLFFTMQSRIEIYFVEQYFNPLQSTLQSWIELYFAERYSTSTLQIRIELFFEEQYSILYTAE